MFVVEATNLLKNVACPICKKVARISNGSPFRIFKAADLHEDCPNKDCKLFYEKLNAHFMEFETGKIDKPALVALLDYFREGNAAE